MGSVTSRNLEYCFNLKNTTWLMDSFSHIAAVVDCKIFEGIVDFPNNERVRQSNPHTTGMVHQTFLASALLFRHWCNISLDDCCDKSCNLIDCDSRCGESCSKFIFQFHFSYIFHDEGKKWQQKSTTPPIHSTSKLFSIYVAWGYILVKMCSPSEKFVLG